MLVDERPGRQCLCVELACREHDLTELPSDLVAVVVDGLKVVVCADRLNLAERLKERLAIPDAHVVDRRAVGGDVGRRESRLAPQLPPHNRVDAPRLPRRAEVTDDLRRLARQFVRLNDEPLVHPWNDRREYDGDEVRADRAQADADEPTANRTPDDGSGADDRDDAQQTQRREPRVEIGVARPKERPMLHEEERRNPNEVNAQRGEQEQARREDRDVDGGNRLDDDSPARTREDDPAREVDRKREQAAEHEHRSDEVEHAAKHREREDVVPDVPAEDRIGDTERRAVEEVERRPPLRRHCEGAEHRDEDRGGDCGDLGEARQHGGTRASFGSEARFSEQRIERDATERRPDVREDDSEGDESSDDAERPLRGDLREKDPLEAEVDIPEPVSEPTRRKRHHGKDEQDECDDA
jgi:hypothetical protein